MGGGVMVVGGNEAGVVVGTGRNVDQNKFIT